MKLGSLFGRTLKHTPPVPDRGTEMALRSALVRFADDSPILLPLGERVLARLGESLEASLPSAQRVVVPPHYSVQDWVRLFQEEIQSYRQLPVTLLSRRNMRSNVQPHGLARPAWYTALEWAEISENRQALKETGDRWKEAVRVWFSSVGLNPQVAEWRPGGLGWLSLNDQGPEKLLTCLACNYLANQEAARIKTETAIDEPLEQLAPVDTPGANTIQALSDYLDVPKTKTLKAIFLTGDGEKHVLAVLRGDFDLSLAKLAGVMGCQSFMPAEEVEIRALGAEPGYAGPVGLRVQVSEDDKGVLVVGDRSIEWGMNFVCGANKPDVHLTGVNYPRDFSVTFLEDIAIAREGDGCPECSEPLSTRRGVYLGGWQDLVTPIRYTDKAGYECDAPAGLGTLLLEPIMASLIELCMDERGLAWPPSLAPFDVHLVDLKCPAEALEALKEIEAGGLSVLHDDRNASPGVKFADADLIGCPLRATVSQRSLDRGGIELSKRGGVESEIVPLDGLRTSAIGLFNSLM
jgi:prolyl-tRNA synthetase